MAERPILFSGPMVRAILSGAKTQTRRILNPQPPHWMDQHLRSGFREWWNPDANVWGPATREGSSRAVIGEDCIRCPYGQPGDKLWVREAFHHTPATYVLEASASVPAVPAETIYRADYPDDSQGWGVWKPSIHMPRWASRITLEVKSVRVERLQDISEEDAKAEGVEPAPFCKAGRPAGLEHVEAFEDLWDSINRERAPWDSNPWVWVVEFSRVSP